MHEKNKKKFEPKDNFKYMEDDQEVTNKKKGKLKLFSQFLGSLNSIELGFA